MDIITAEYTTKYLYGVTDDGQRVRVDHIGPNIDRSRRESPKVKITFPSASALKCTIDEMRSVLDAAEELYDYPEHE